MEHKTKNTSTMELVAGVLVPVSTQTPDPVIQSCMAAKQDLRVSIVPTTAAEDDHLVNTLVEIVNAVYRETEGNVFIDEYQRTDASEFRTFIRAGEIGVAFLDAANKPLENKAIGCIRVQRLSNTHGEFGMMALDAQHRGGGYGRDLVRFAEDHCRSLGLTVMQLELLFPQEFEHAFKKQLMDWYLRMGYELVRLGVFQDDYPHIAAKLTCPCDYRIFEKAL